MPTTTADLCSETRRMLLASSREIYATLTTTVTSSSATIVIGNDPGIFNGSVIEIDAELIYIFSMVSSSATIVVRGWMGTTPAAHTAGALITVNPRWPTVNIYKALSDEIVSYSSPAHGLYTMAAVNFTASAAAAAYDLAGTPVAPGLIDVYDVRASHPGLTADWVRVDSWELNRDQDATHFPSGYALRVYSELLPGRTVRVQYKKAFTPLPTPVNLAYDVAGTGLPSEATDIPPLGAAARLLATREARRSVLDVQPEPRQAADVPPGTARQAAGGYLALRNQRIAEERVRLQARYPDNARRGG